MPADGDEGGFQAARSVERGKASGRNAAHVVDWTADTGLAEEVVCFGTAQERKTRSLRGAHAASEGGEWYSVVWWAVRCLVRHEEFGLP